MTEPAVVETVSINFDKLTLGDLADIEDAGGDLKNLESPKTILALVWVTKRQTMPTFTLADARRMTFKEFEVEFSGGDRDPKGNGNSDTSPASAVTTD